MCFFFCRAEATSSAPTGHDGGESESDDLISGSSHASDISFCHSGTSRARRPVDHKGVRHAERQPLAASRSSARSFFRRLDNRIVALGIRPRRFMSAACAAAAAP